MNFDRYISTKLTQTIIRLSIFSVIRAFYGLEVKGLDNIRNIGSNFIIAANHQGISDPLYILSAFPFSKLPLLHTSNSGIIREKKFGRLLSMPLVMHLLGAINLNFGLKNYEKSLCNALEALNRGYNVVIFPQGRVCSDMKPGEAKGGVAYLAMATGKPVIPVMIKKTGKKTMLFIGKKLAPSQIFFGLTREEKNCFAGAKKIMEVIKLLDSD